MMWDLIKHAVLVFTFVILFFSLILSVQLDIGYKEAFDLYTKGMVNMIKNVDLLAIPAHMGVIYEYFRDFLRFLFIH